MKTHLFKYCKISNYVRSLKYDTKEQSYETKTLTDAEKRLEFSTEAGPGEGRTGTVILGGKLFYTEWEKKQGLIVQHWGLHPISCDKP